MGAPKAHTINGTDGGERTQFEPAIEIQTHTHTRGGEKFQIEKFSRWIEMIVCRHAEESH